MKTPHLSSIRSRAQSAPAAQSWSAFILLFFIAFAAPRSLALDDHNPIGVTGAFEGVTTTAGAYNVVNHSATRQIDDIVVPGAIGKYGLKMTRYFNSRRGYGDGWGFEYFWASINGKIYYPNGSVWDNSCTDEWALPGPLGVSDWPTTWNGSPAFRLADGGTIVFGDVRWTSVATKVIDPYGQITSITLDSNSGRITRVTEPGGRYLQFTYNGSSLLTQVDAYDGRGNRTDYVVYHYTAIRPAGGGTSGTPVNCLTSVDYSDGTHAYYAYQDDNVPDHPGPPCPCSIKVYPLLRTCQDVRYKGPMRHICYDYQDNGPHGAIIAERYSLNGSTNGVRVSRIDPPAPSPLVTEANFDTIYTEYRGDGPSRTFTYTSLHLSRVDGESCPTWNLNLSPAPQQFLTDYTDFGGNSTHLGYDTNWYVNSVRDANTHTTSYVRGSPPPAGIGEILTITHPGGSHIDYTYYDHGHYLKQITNERGAITYHFRDANQRITRTDYKDWNNNLLANETFTYSDDFGQVLAHRLKNGSYVHFQYDNRGLLTAKTNPTTISDWQTAISQAPKTTYSYYTSGPWTDRVQTMTLPANVSGSSASDTYEYDRAFDNNGVTNLNGTAVAGRGLVTKITHADTPSNTYQRFKYDWYGNKVWQDNELRKITQYGYDDYNRLLSVTDPLINTTQYDYAPTQGNATQSQQHSTNSPWWVTTPATPANIVTHNVYDQNWRKTSSTPA